MDTFLRSLDYPTLFVLFLCVEAGCVLLLLTGPKARMR